MHSFSVCFPLPLFSRFYTQTGVGTEETTADFYTDNDMDNNEWGASLLARNGMEKISKVVKSRTCALESLISKFLASNVANNISSGQVKVKRLSSFISQVVAKRRLPEGNSQGSVATQGGDEDGHRR